MNIKMKCYNEELEKWDECAYPLFKGMNPVEVIGFQDNDGRQRLIVEGNAVKLFTGSHDSQNNEIYDGDILKSVHNGVMFAVHLNHNNVWVIAPYDGQNIYINENFNSNLAMLSDEFILVGKNICETNYLEVGVSNG